MARVSFVPPTKCLRLSHHVKAAGYCSPIGSIVQILPLFIFASHLVRLVFIRQKYCECTQSK